MGVDYGAGKDIRWFDVFIVFENPRRILRVSLNGHEMQLVEDKGEVGKVIEIPKVAALQAPDFFAMKKCCLLKYSMDM